MSHSAPASEGQASGCITSRIMRSARFEIVLGGPNDNDFDNHDSEQLALARQTDHLSASFLTPSPQGSAGKSDPLPTDITKRQGQGALPRSPDTQSFSSCRVTELVIFQSLLSRIGTIKSLITNLDYPDHSVKCRPNPCDRAE